MNKKLFFKKDYPEIIKFFGDEQEYITYNELLNIFVNNVSNLNRSIEGFVVVDINGNWFKTKLNWYLERHRAKDFVNQPSAFIELVLKDEADDVFALLEDQPVVLKEMQDLQHKVINKANTLVNSVTMYWKTNKDLSRKDYAIKGKGELDILEFALAMMFYTTGEEPNWNQFLLKQIKKIAW